MKEKASKLRNSLPKDILSSTSSRNILALTFRQVVLQQLWNFELVSFGAGSERDMEDLENSREVGFGSLQSYFFTCFPLLCCNIYSMSVLQVPFDTSLVVLLINRFQCISPSAHRMKPSFL